MIVLTFFTDNSYLVMNANVVIIEKADIRWQTDHHVGSLECDGGWWEIYNVCGKLCAYWEDDESI